MTTNRNRTKSPKTDARPAAAYIRLTAAESLLTGLSAPAQRQDATEYAKRAGLPLAEIVEEPKAIGADVPLEKRHGGRRLLELIAAGAIGHLIVRDLDRLTREVQLNESLVALVRGAGVTIHTFSGPVSLKSPSDRFATRVRAAAAQLEREQTGDRGRRAKRQLAVQGRHTGGPPPYGYTSQARRFAELKASGLTVEQARVAAETELPLRGHLYTDESEAAVVRLIYEQYMAGVGVRRIANDLNSRGHRRRSGGLWHPEKVRKVVMDPVLAGFVPFDEEFFEDEAGSRSAKADQHLYQGKHTAIIDEATWRAAQEQRKTTVGVRANGTQQRRYPLSGVLRCECGSLMKAGSTHRDGRFVYYACRRRKSYGPTAIGGCDKPPVRIDRIHAAFWPAVLGMLDQPGLVDRVYHAAKTTLEEQARKAAQRQHPIRQLAKIDQDLERWYVRHDDAATEAEKDAAWRRIVALTEWQREVAAEIEAKPLPAVSTIISRGQIAARLRGLASSIAGTKDEGKGLVAALAEKHSLAVLVRGNSLAVSLDVGLPGASVPLTADAAMNKAGNKVDVWLAQQDQPACSVCGKPIKILRRHYWRGLPRVHHKCMGQYHAELRRRQG